MFNEVFKPHLFLFAQNHFDRIGGNDNVDLLFLYVLQFELILHRKKRIYINVQRGEFTQIHQNATWCDFKCQTVPLRWSSLLKLNDMLVKREGIVQTGRYF